MGPAGALCPVRLLTTEYQGGHDAGAEPVRAWRPADERRHPERLWHARSLAYTSGTLPRLLEWLHLPGDLVFNVLGAAPFALAMCLNYLALWTRRDVAVMPKPVSAEWLVTRRKSMSGCGPNAKCRLGPEMSAVGGRPDLSRTSRNRRV